MLIISAVFLWIITLQQVSCQEGYYNVYDDHAEYGNTPSKPCNVGRPGDPDLSDDDLLRSYGFNEDYWSYIGVQKTVGSTYHQTAYHFEEYANLTIESSRAFPTGFPWEFSFEATFRLPVFLPQNKWNLFELTSFYSNSEMSLAINPYFRSMELALPKYDGSLQQIVFEEIEIFDRSWHKVMFGVGQDQVRLWIDCLPVHNERGSVVTPLDVRGPIDSREGAFTIAQDCQTRKSIPIDLQWMIFSCDKNKPQYTRCEELIPINPPKNVNSLNTLNLPQYESTTPPKLPIDLSFMTSTPQSESTESSLIPEGLRSKDLSICPEQCPMGPPGPPGLPGISGQKGEPGTEVNSPVLIGPKALPGQKGEPGSVGPAGPPGPSGFIANDNRTLVLPGPKGPPGLQGLPGLTGAKGEMGLPGINGQPGPRGTKGDSGPKGETGSRGLKGEAGREGISGIDGRDGIPGPRGQSGPPGLPGPPGRPGMSFAAPEPLLDSMEPEQIRAICMEVVKDYVAEITKSLVGPQGIPGVPGRSIVGPRGPQGIQGDKGMRGEAGERGFSGLPGVPGNPGSIGIRGEPGQKGEQGNNGVGLPGPVGPEGPRGAPGPSVTGPIGKPGQTGPKGHNGYDGLPGSPGRPGQCPDCSSHLAALSYPALYQQQQRNSKGPQNTKGPQED